MDRKEFLKVSAVAALAMPSTAEHLVNRGERWTNLSADDEGFWSFVRAQFPLTRDRVYFNTGGLGASPYAVIDAVKAKMDELEKISETGHTEGLWKEMKTRAGGFFGCDADELAFMRNATEGINVVCNGLPLGEGDEVITTTHEHVANAVPWLALQKRRRIVLKFFEPSTASAQENVARVERLLSTRTRLISVPHVTTTTGQILPIRELADLARARRIWLFVDGAQAAGMLPLNLHELGCDAYAFCGHKWLLGPKETGYLYVRKDMLDIVQAKFVGAYSDHGYDFQKGELAFHPSAQRYEYGTVNIPLRVGLDAALQFLTRIGMANVWKRDQQLSTYLHDRLRSIPKIRVLSPASDTERSAMVTFQHESVPFLELQAHLNSYNLRTRGVSEGGVNGLRISCHIYNSREEIDKLIEGLKSVRG
ncbi:MAG: cysteine desulfurase [Bacteroidia bacterium]|nr:MAG: cysteine desulfurase [Bacteroidia bacterium]